MRNNRENNNFSTLTPKENPIWSHLESPDSPRIVERGNSNDCDDDDQQRKHSHSQCVVEVRPAKSVRQLHSLNSLTH